MNFHHGFNFDDVKGIFMLKIPITVSKSYGREKRVGEREKKEREGVFTGTDVKMCFSSAIYSVSSK